MPPRKPAHVRIRVEPATIGLRIRNRAITPATLIHRARITTGMADSPAETSDRLNGTTNISSPIKTEQDNVKDLV